MIKHLTFPSPLALFVGALSVVFIFAVVQPSARVPARGPSPIPTPPTMPAGTPQALAITGILGATNATGGQGIGESDIRAFVMNHNVPGNMGSKTFSITLVKKLPAEQITAMLNGAPTGQPQGTLLWYVELAGQFRFPGSSKQPDGLPYTTGFEVFIASNGNLLMEGGLVNPTGGATPVPQPTSTPAGVPTATPVAGGSTPTPVPTSVPPTATPVPPTATPVPHVCTLVSQGSNQLNVDIGYFDFDAGSSSISASPGSDLHYQAAPSSTFTAINSTAIYKWGVGSPTCSAYLTVGYVPGGTVAVTAGTTYMERTNGGHIAIFKVTSFSPDIITIDWQLYSVS